MHLLADAAAAVYRLATADNIVPAHHGKSEESGRSDGSNNLLLPGSTRTIGRLTMEPWSRKVVVKEEEENAMLPQQPLVLIPMAF